MPDWPRRKLSTKPFPFVSTASEWVRRSGLQPTWTSAAPGASNYGMAYPIYVPQEMVARHLFCFNGSVVSGNIQMCIANANGVTLPHTVTPPEPQDGVSLWQVFSIPDTLLSPGVYLLGVALSAPATARLTALASGNANTFVQGWLGGGAASISFPIPATWDYFAEDYNYFVPALSVGGF